MGIKKRMISLKYLIAYLALAAMIVTMVNSVLAGYRISREALLENTKEMNRVYAAKLADITNHFLTESQAVLESKAKDIPSWLKSPSRLKEEVSDLFHSARRFHAAFVMDNQGRIMAAYPGGVDAATLPVAPDVKRQALEAQGAFISEPFSDPDQGLLLFLAHPFLNAKGQPAGVVGGTILLNEANGLGRLLGEHYYRDGSTVYIVDRQGRIIYHQDPRQVNGLVPENPAVQKVLKGQSGAEEVTEDEGETMLAGYSPVPLTGWGVVSQRPADITLHPASAMALELFHKILPLFGLTLLLAIWIARGIARPLHQLSSYVENASHEKPHHLSEIKAWYYEARELKKAVLKNLNTVHAKMTHLVKEATTDPLTGLVNRRTLENCLHELEKQLAPFSVIILDVDHFKKINDTYGHQVGDEVIKFLAEKIRQNSRQGDVCCRFGGEEFVILIPGASSHSAFQAAERLRKAMADNVSPTGSPITISLGIASYPKDSTEVGMVLEKADQALYQAKKNGRNRTETVGTMEKGCVEPPAFLNW